MWRTALVSVGLVLAAPLIFNRPARGEEPASDLVSVLFYGKSAEQLVELRRSSLGERSSRWLCTPTTTYLLEEKGLRAETPSQQGPLGFVTLDFKRSVYSRCDGKSCDAWDMRVSDGGTFSVVDVPGAGAFLKAFNDGSEYVEVRTHGMTVFANFGTCIPTP